MSARVIVFFILVSFLIDSCNSPSGKRKSKVSGSESKGISRFFEVTKVVDGDTFWAEDGTNKSVKVRLIGVDAPEARDAFNKKRGYFGKEAKAYLTKLLDNKRVRLEFDVNRIDQFGRTLAYVYLEDGTFVNADLIKNGYAMVMTVPPNVNFADYFLKLQEEARENRRGLWNDSND